MKTLVFLALLGVGLHGAAAGELRRFLVGLVGGLYIWINGSFDSL